MLELDGTLSELARLRSGSEPIVSLYLDLRWSDEQQRERVRLFAQDCTDRALAHYLPDSPGRDGLERTLERVRDHVGGLVAHAYDESRKGLALFACESLGLWRLLTFARPFENALGVDAICHLGQLARLADDVPPAIAVLPSREGADVFVVERGEIDAEGHPRGELPRGGEKSWNAGTGVESSGRGESARQYEREAKNEREVENHVQKNLRTAAAQVTALFDQHPGAKVLLFGTNGNLALFEGELHERVASHVIARLPRPREWQANGGALRSGVVAAVAEGVARCEHGAEEKVVEAVVGEALRGGVAVMGPEDVVDALNQGRVHRLVLEADFARTGWRCDQCDALGARDGHPTCPYCGGDTRVVHALGEALVARAFAEGAEVEVVAHSKKLHGYRGVAAFLRQSAPTGLKGASPSWAAAPGANQGA
jgi:hypothetical protein